MSFFKQQLEADINAAFLNLDEYAEELEIDGVIRKAVVDDSQGGFSVGARDALANTAGIGLIENGRVLYLEDNFLERPVPGQVLEIDGEKWRVNDDPASVRIEMGILVLHISREWS